MTSYHSRQSEMRSHRPSSIRCASRCWCSTRSCASSAASRSFYETFQVAREDTQGRLLYTLGDGQWDIPALRTLLDKVLPEEWVLEGFEVEHEFPKIGRRTMLLN